MSNTMNAYVLDAYGPPSNLHLRQVPRPVPAPNEVLVRVAATGLNAADWRIMRAQPFLVRMEFGWKKPRIPVIGVDMAGTVIGVGNEVTAFRPGDRVLGSLTRCGMGAFGEYATANPDCLFPVPDNLSLAEAACIPISGLTAYHALVTKAEIQPGDHVLINGASGGVGTYTVQLAKALGAEVTGVCSGKNVELVRSLGADHVINYEERDFTREDQRYDVIIDNVANHSLGKLRRRTTAAGRVVIVGFTSMRRMIGQVLLHPILNTFGSKKSMILNYDWLAKDLKPFMELVKGGKIKSVIERTYPYSELPEAMAFIETKHAAGKVVVTVGKE